MTFSFQEYSKENRLIYRDGETPQFFAEEIDDIQNDGEDGNQAKEKQVKQNPVDAALDKLGPKHAKLIEAAKKELTMTPLNNRNPLVPSWKISVFKKGGGFIDSVRTSDPNFQGEMIRIMQENVEDPNVLPPEVLQKAQNLQSREQPDSRVLSALGIHWNTLDPNQIAFVKTQVQDALGIKEPILINAIPQKDQKRLPCEVSVLSAKDKRPLAVCTLSAQGNDTTVSHIQLNPGVRDLPKKTFISLVANLSGNTDLNNPKLIDEGKVKVKIVKEKTPNGNYHVELIRQDFNGKDQVAAELMLDHTGALVPGSVDSKPRIK